MGEEYRHFTALAAGEETVRIPRAELLASMVAQAESAGDLAEAHAQDQEGVGCGVRRQILNLPTSDAQPTVWGKDRRVVTSAAIAAVQEGKRVDFPNMTSVLE